MPAEWYDFVPLPGQKYPAPDAEGLTHARHVPGRHSGYLDLTLATKSPLHIGSGAYELSEDAGLKEGTVVRGMTGAAGRHVIPSSSLKGALRSAYETITYSCIGRPRTSSSERYCRDPEKSELPQALIDDMPADLQERAENARNAHPQDVPKISVRLDTRELDSSKRCELKKGQRNFETLCPACALFGTENFQGRMSFDDAQIIELPKEPKHPVQLPSLYGPRLHRLGEPTVISGKAKPFVLVRNLKGRKAYYNVQLGDVPAEGQILVDYLTIGARLKTRLHFRNVTLAELGGLLTALASDPEYSFPFRVGGAKPVGLGYIAFELQAIRALKSEAAFTEFDPPAAEELTVEACLKAFRQSEGTLLYRKGLEKLCEITARPYVPAQERNL